MKIIDFIFLNAIAGTVAMAYFLGHWSICIFLLLVFFIMLTNVALHYLTQPLPRFIIGAFSPTPEELEELKNEFKKEE